MRNPNDEIIEFIRGQFNKKPGVFITNEKKVNNGIDFYATSQKYIQVLGKKLKRNFCGELKISSKLHTRNKQTSRNVYRVNVLFRLAKCKLEDILNFKGEEIKVLKMGKKILAKNLKTGKKLNINYGDL